MFIVAKNGFQRLTPLAKRLPGDTLKASGKFGVEIRKLGNISQ